ncbi:hypothetical protein BDZ94DRAFT_1263163 [Collybia nuda]|uniref:Flavin-containing monooxygenase n=1 Tax=Collybia nuda TaxID=64659 RepID=A0A9P5Y5L2_9AGAR|nr:hypothetical protein BDZ94DRAFT_1263163 [Collybia nuda]
MEVVPADIPNVPLPTFDRLGVSVPPDLDVKRVAFEWFEEFSSSIRANDAQGVSNLFLADSFWRDILAFTWDVRTFLGSEIAQFLIDRLRLTNATAFSIRDDEYLVLQRPYPDLAWISFMFDFETDVGFASGIGRIVPTSGGQWKAHCMFTNLENLKGYPEMLGPLRNQAPNHGKWEADRKREVEFIDADPVVLVVGAGQSGLAVAASLKTLQVPTLVVEKLPRIGDNWRTRYEALCLHDPVWYDHMPYLPFPATWPVYTPAVKMGNWLEYYSDALELNVWTSTTLTKATQDPDTYKWHVTLIRDGKERTLFVKHIIFATGIGSDVPRFPEIPGKENYGGIVLHSCQHKSAKDHIGKKVLVIGACTSAHDIAVDYYEHDIDVTMYQRSSTYVMTTKNGWKLIMAGSYCEGGPPTDIVDRHTASFSNFIGIGLAQRRVKAIAELDKDLLDGLRKRGFQINFGYLDTGSRLLAWSKRGGYYLDTGGSQLIADGKIKLKSGGNIKSFTQKGLRFEDGTEIDTDVVLFATGYGDPAQHIRDICGDAVADECGPIWGLNREGEIIGVWRELKVKGLWPMLGNLALSRFHSKHVALQIKAMEVGVFGQRYSL